MMTVPEEGAERLAEIFREIVALSETNRPNHSKSADDDSIKSFDTQGTSGTPETCAPKGKQAIDQCSQSEDQEPRR